MKKPTVQTYKKKAWPFFSKYIRLRDADENGMCKCVTCGVEKHFKDMQAGHGVGGRHNYLLFDEEIVFAQCPACNIFGGGQYEKFAVFLIEKHDLEWYKEKLRYKVVQFTIPELEEKIQTWKNFIETKSTKS